MQSKQHASTANAELLKMFESAKKEGLVVQTAVGPRGSFVVRGAAAAAMAAGNTGAVAQKAAKEEDELLGSPLCVCVCCSCPRSLPLSISRSISLSLAVSVRATGATAAAPQKTPDKIFLMPLPPAPLSLSPPSRMFSALKSQGFVVEKAFDGGGSIVVRSPEAAAALQQALRQNEDAEDKPFCVDEAKSKWRNAANKIEEDKEEGGDEGEEDPEEGNDGATPSASLPMNELVGRKTRISCVTNPEINNIVCTVLSPSKERGRVIVKLDTGQKMNIQADFLAPLEEKGNQLLLMSDSQISMMPTPLQGAAAQCNPQASPMTQTSPTERSKTRKYESRSGPEEEVEDAAGPVKVGKDHASCVCIIS